MSIKGYSVVNLKGEDGKHSEGFRKIISALTNWEKLRDEQEERYEELLQKALRDAKEPNWFQRVFLKIDSKMQLVCHTDYKGDLAYDSTLYHLGLLTKKEFMNDVGGSLQFIRDKTEYNKLCAIIKNGEQFMLDDKLCSFVNSYSTYKPQGGK